MDRLPIVDISPLIAGTDAGGVAAAIRDACTGCGFFYIAGHGIRAQLQDDLERASRRFFALPPADKSAIAMARGARAWRGYFGVGAELTAGVPDRKEGLYFGVELGASDPRVRAGTPLHGPNLFPRQVPELHDIVLAYIEALTSLGHTLAAGVALALELPASYFRERYTYDPLVLFRIFNYPAALAGNDAAGWGVGEHTDYGFLTILKQDGTGGLQVKTRDGWIDAPPLPGTFVCNVGDMLDRMTGGRFRSTPHRVLNVSGRDRLAFPFFFDPSWDARVEPIDGAGAARGGDERWDGADIHAPSETTYGDYLLAKVAKVFPTLTDDVL